MWGSDVARCKTEMHIYYKKYNKGGDVVIHAMSPLLGTRERSAKNQRFEGTLSVPALNYVAPLGILGLAEVGRRSSCRRQVRNTLGDKLVVWFTAI